VAQKTRAQLEAELRALKSARRSQGWFYLSNNLVKWSAIVLIVRYVYLAIDSLAGRNTLADIGLNILGHVEVSVALAWTVGIVGAIYGWRQRDLRKSTVELLQTRIIELERSIDSKRSSSKLTPRGDTRPEDIP
jgi:hypothetical protein